MLNKIMLIGRLGRDPEFRTTATGIALAKFTMATDEKRRGEGGELQTNTEWHRIVIWRRQAEIARDYLHKGSLIYLEGRIHYDSYENKEGQKVYTTEITADRFQMLDSRGDSQGGGAPSGASSRAGAQEPVKEGGEPGGGFDQDDDLPF